MPAPASHSTVFQIGLSSASLTVRIAESRKTLSVSPLFWDTAKLIVRSSSGAVEQTAEASATADPATGARSCTFSLNGISVGSTYNVELTLLRKGSPSEIEVTVARSEKSGVIISPGDNVLTFDDWTTSSAMDLGPSTLTEPYVTSVTGFGPFGKLADAQGCVVDSSGRYIFVDFGTIRALVPDNSGKLSGITLCGKPSTLGQGFRDGSKTEALFRSPTSIALGPDNKFYISDTGNHAIRVLSLEPDYNVSVTTIAGTGLPGFADGSGENAQFSAPQGLCFDSDGNLFVADSGNNRIRKISFDGNGHALVSTVAGIDSSGSVDGSIMSARLSSPIGVALGSNGDIFFVEPGTRKLRRISHPGESSAQVSTIAGSGANSDVDGSGTSASFSQIKSIRNAPDGSILVLTASRLRRVHLDPNGTTTVVSIAGGGTIRGQDGLASSASIVGSNQISFDASGNPLIVGRNLMLKVEEDGAGQRFVKRIFGDYKQSDSSFMDGPADYRLSYIPNDFTFGENGEIFACMADSMQVVQLDVSSGHAVPSVIAGGGSAGYRDGPGITSLFNNPQMMLHVKGQGILVADSLNHCIRKIVLNPDGTYSTLTLIGDPNINGIADGPPGTALFERPFALTADRAGNVYVADKWNSTIRKLTFTNGTPYATTVAGRPRTGTGGYVDGPINVAEFNSPSGIAVDQDQNLLVSDSGNFCIRKISFENGVAKEVSTLVGRSSGYADGTLDVAKFQMPWEICFDESRNRLYILDNYRVRQIQFGKNTAPVVSTLAGSDAGYSDGLASIAKFGKLIGMALDRNGVLYLADYDNRLIRKVFIK
jgi:sugar lactone lactonase YvrE